MTRCKFKQGKHCMLRTNREYVVWKGRKRAALPKVKCNYTPGRCKYLERHNNRDN